MAAHCMPPTAMNVEATVQEQHAAIHGNEVLPIQSARRVGHIHSRRRPSPSPTTPLPSGHQPYQSSTISCASRMLASTLRWHLGAAEQLRQNRLS
jgi:hypothetical protein